jgi:hypothetical protein
MDENAESFPMMLYRRFRGGESAQQLAEAFEISEDRIEVRLRAAALCDERRKMDSALNALRANLASG